MYAVQFQRIQQAHQDLGAPFRADRRPPRTAGTSRDIEGDRAISGGRECRDPELPGPRRASCGMQEHDRNAIAARIYVEKSGAWNCRVAIACTGRRRRLLRGCPKDAAANSVRVAAGRRRESIEKLIAESEP